MKKNNMLRLASVLLVAVLLSTCAISGVFAHYYTDDKADDTARVAKWGVVVTATSDAFSPSYDVSDTTKTVVALGGATNVVAPGTEGALAAMTVTGQPEVSVVVTKKADIELTGWVIPAPTDADADATKEYCPIVIKVGQTEYKLENYTDIDALEAAIEAAILGDDDGVYEYGPNTDLAGESLDVNVTWAWAFGDKSADDTALGNLTTAPEISIDVSIEVEQVGD